MIVDAVLDVARPAEVVRDGSVGARTAKVDGPAKLTGTERYGADAIPADALYLRVIRSPHASARFTVGDLDAFVAARPGLERALTARDVPTNLYGIYPTIKDQPVLADGLARYRGDPVVAFVGTRAAIEAIRDEDVPITYEPLPPIVGIEAAKAAAPIHAGKDKNILADGGVTCGDVEARARRPRRTWPRSNTRPASSSTPISSRRPAGRSARATRWKCMSRPRIRSSIATTWRRS